MLKKVTALPALVLIALTGFSGISIAQYPFNCFTNGGVSTLSRSEGISELAGDLVVVCLSGTPTAPGAPVPAADIPFPFYRME